KANVTKLVRLRNFTVPQRELKGRIEKASDVEEKTDKNEALGRAVEITKRLLEHKKESKIVKMAKRKIAEVKEAPEEKSEVRNDDDEKMEETVERKVEDKAEQKLMEEAEKLRQREAKLRIRATTRPISRINVTAKDLPIGTMAVVYAAGAQYLAKVIANRLVRTDPGPWIKVQLYGSYDIKGIYDRKYNPQWIMNGIEVIRQNRPHAHGTSWVELYASDFLFVLEHALTYEHYIDPRDWARLKALYKDDIEIMKTQTVSTEENSEQRRKLRRI